MLIGYFNYRIWQLTILPQVIMTNQEIRDLIWSDITVTESY